MVWLRPVHSHYQDRHKAPILTKAQYQKTLSSQVSATQLELSAVAAGEMSASQLQGGKGNDSQRTSSRKGASSSAKQSSGHVRKAKRLPLRLAPFAAPRLQTIPVPPTWAMPHCFFSNVSVAAPGVDVSQTCRTLYQLAALHAQNALHRLTDAARTEKDRQADRQHKQTAFRHRVGTQMQMQTQTNPEKASSDYARCPTVRRVPWPPK
ncbi:hypothetical protein CFIO01_11371 [Colletotrichum fioriniae PJ7]|uniref:Uncharacterized protein n=1 Tax=Colletotrichum fioriniae PJ7 TaxID=1445577 RepID=A0A010R5A7_9PEZI|nr:hypothetical protein CFIO01_11371 [Colletotrichum fioriniae PJ7]